MVYMKNYPNFGGNQNINLLSRRYDTLVSGTVCGEPDLKKTVTSRH